MAPPVTPSPHRFVIKKQAQLRSTPLAQSQTPGQSSQQQFNATPRFNFSSTPRPTPSQHLSAPTTPAPRFLTPARPVYTYEEIADLSSDGLQDVHDSIETEDQEDQETGYKSEGLDDSYQIQERSQKFRKLTASVDTDGQVEDHTNELRSSPPPSLLSPQNARRQFPSMAPKFIIASSTISSTLIDTQPTFIKPPRFRPPDPAEQAQSQQDPSPDQFSPHRRGEKYMPGGLAAEVREWLMNIEISGAVNAAQKKDDVWLVTLVVEDISGDSRNCMTMVKGDPGNGGPSMQVLLAGESEGIGLQRGARVQVGRTVGIKGPVWDVEIDGEKWGVGVDWKVLS
ncbi:hypothetical protein BJ878DRAFT_577270 [Calycina marina]|uniref:Uncharacterized protein n=1 Tax=Calycina marina TaxID=1763456 RepID=A0A9P7Z0F8_9HELO|nr:hypothetical protein BJ878DRAFT_577270 [Calycina marina]